MSDTSLQDRVQRLNSEYEKSNKDKLKNVPKKTGSILYSYASKLVNHRVLDLYLKALGITTLTPITLVPLSLVMGATTFSDTVEDILGLEKRANGSSTKRRKTKKVKKDSAMHIPILDDKIFGTYVKYTGAAVQLALSPLTLVPLGFAIAIYEWFQYMTEPKEQTGGGSSWIISQNSGGPINSANIWANWLSSKFSVFGREMTPIETQAITGYPFQQQPNTHLTIQAAPEPLHGLGTGTYSALGGSRRTSRRRRSRSKSRSRVRRMYRRRRSSRATRSKDES